MRVRLEQLPAQLKQGLSPIYLVSGDEPLQRNEACDAIRAAARDAGFSQREIFEVGTSFDWNQLLAEANALSLFAEQKIIDLRIPNGKLGRDGGAALTEYCSNPPQDTLLLITLPKLDRTQQNSKWFKAVEQNASIIQIWPVEPKQLPGWIAHRLKLAGFNATPDAAQLLSDRVEGNLLAAHQEIEKLSLLREAGPLSAEDLLEVIADSARYDVFELVDSALRGELHRCLKILAGLKGEGIAPPVVLWALHREVAQLASLSTDVAKGLSMDHALTRAKVWDKRKPMVSNALKRLKPPQWLSLMAECSKIDASAKGANEHDAWQLLETSCSTLCGYSTTI